jgi:hypothetical protein
MPERRRLFHPRVVSASLDHHELGRREELRKCRHSDEAGVAVLRSRDHKHGNGDISESRREVLRRVDAKNARFAAKL